MTTMSPATIAAKVAFTVKARLWRDFFITRVPMSDADIFWTYNQFMMASDVRCSYVDRRFYDFIKEVCGVRSWTAEEIDAYDEAIDDMNDAIADDEDARAEKTFQMEFGIYMTDESYEERLAVEDYV